MLVVWQGSAATPLLVAAETMHLDIVQWLLHHGADPTFTDAVRYPRVQGTVVSPPANTSRALRGDTAVGAGRGEAVHYQTHRAQRGRKAAA